MLPAGLIMIFASIPFWLLCIRPYARRHGAGHITGINFWVAAWVDWQQAREIAEKRDESLMVVMCWLYLLLAGGGPALMVLGLWA